MSLLSQIPKPVPPTSSSSSSSFFVCSKMGSVFGVSRTKEELEIALAKVKQLVSSHPVIVFSKTYCVYCKKVKQLFTQLGATFKVIELNQESDGSDMQAALAEWTGRTTVPNVFISGNNVGGCDSVMELNQSGQLKDLLIKAGAIVN